MHNRTRWHIHLEYGPKVGDEEVRREILSFGIWRLFIKLAVGYILATAPYRDFQHSLRADKNSL